MPSFISRVSQFARSPQGRKLMGQAQRLAKDPKTKARIDDARRKLMARGGKGRPAA